MRRTRDTTAAIAARRQRAEARKAALIEDLEFMRETGETWDRAAARFEITPKGLEKRLRVLGRLDLRESLLSNAEHSGGVRCGRILAGRWSA